MCATAQQRRLTTLRRWAALSSCVACACMCGGGRGTAAVGFGMRMRPRARQCSSRQQDMPQRAGEPSACCAMSVLYGVGHSGRVNKTQYRISVSDIGPVSALWCRNCTLACDIACRLHSALHRWSSAQARRAIGGRAPLCSMLALCSCHSCSLGLTVLSRLALLRSADARDACSEQRILAALLCTHI
jgi:hypothetical protein